jgi:hypothetical protein
VSGKLNGEYIELMLRMLLHLPMCDASDPIHKLTHLYCLGVFVIATPHAAFFLSSLYTMKE